MTGARKTFSATSQLRCVMFSCAVITLCAGVFAQDSTADSSVVSSKNKALVVEEEDIFSEISKQGIRIDGAEKSLVVKPGAVSGSEADDSVNTPDSIGNAALKSPSDTIDNNAPVPSRPYDDERRGRYGKYGPPSGPGAQGGEGPVTAATPAADTMVTGPARIDDIKAVNFARNVKQYRSPRLAMFLSLLLPGLGQAYARSAWQSAVFGVVEAAIVATGIVYNVKWRNSVDDSRSFANRHYDPTNTQLSSYYEAFKAYVDTVEAYSRDTNGVAFYDAKQVLETFFFLGADGDFVSEYNSLRSSKSQLYYELISGKAFVHGWDDAEPLYSDMFRAAPGEQLIGGTTGRTYTVHDHVDPISNRPDSAFYVWYDRSATRVDTVMGFSPHQIEYNGMVSTANSYYRTSTNVFLLLLVNHVASAIEAGILAKRQNDRQLGKESMWNNIRIEQRTVNTGHDIVPGFAIAVDF